MISVAADLAGVHPQTLRIYERKCLVAPQRSAGNTRLYSQADVERLREIQRLTQEEGINLAGVTQIIELQRELERMRAELDACGHAGQARRGVCASRAGGCSPTRHARGHRARRARGRRAAVRAGLMMPGGAQSGDPRSPVVRWLEGLTSGEVRGGPG